MTTDLNVPPPERGRRRRLPRGGWRSALSAALIVGAVVLPLSAARPSTPAPAPAAVSAPATADALDGAYAAHRAGAARAARMADSHGDRYRAAVNRFLAAPSRHLLAYDGRGDGRVTEVFGDLAHARHIAVLVPGSNTGINTYDRFHAAARSLYRQLAREAPADEPPAVVAWLGYETPGTASPSVATTGRAEAAAPRLRALVRELRSLAGPGAHLSLLCHSYGSAVCGRAAADLDADDIVLAGSPGTGSGSAGALHTPARVWAARGGEDWVANVPHVSVGLFGTTLGLGADPVSPSFGARVFDAGEVRHSDYFTSGSPSLANMARIAAGRTAGVTRA